MRKKFKALPKLKSLLLFLLLDLIFSERETARERDLEQSQASFPPSVSVTRSELPVRETAREREIELYHSSHPLLLFLFLGLTFWKEKQIEKEI
jgi:hypothetical protein